MKSYPKYKDSEIDWLEEIPYHWKSIRLKFLASIYTGDKDTVNRVDDGKYPFFVRSQTVERINTYSYDGEAVLTAGDGVGVGKVFHYYNGKFDFHQRVYKISNFEQIDGKYFYYYFMQNFHKEVLKISAKSTVDSLRLPMLQNFRVSFGSLDEQRIIASFLDQKLNQIDTLIVNKKQMIELLKEERAAIINQAVTKGINPDAEMKDSGIEWLGEVPKHWIISKLKYLSRIRYGLGQPPKQVEGGLPMIRATNVERGRIVKKDMMFVSSEDVPKEREPFLCENEIIVVRSGAYTADSAIIPKEYEGAVAGYDMVVTPKAIQPKFLSYGLLSQYILNFQLDIQKLRAAQPHLNAEELGATLVLCPPFHEQTIITEYITKRVSEIDKTIELAIKEISLFEEYRIALINEAVTGKIDVRGNL